MQLADFDYDLPADRIAQQPAPERTDARLLVCSRSGDTVEDRHIRDLPEILRAGDLLVLNDARVIPARLRARRPSGGQLEVLLIGQRDGGGTWEALVRGAPRVGERVEFSEGGGEWLAALGGGRWHLRLDVSDGVLAWLDRVGEIPLPPYIRRPHGPEDHDADRYQTVFARVPGAIAAPTAGLHFTASLLEALVERGVGHTMLTLHVGPGTFLPVRDGDLDRHTMLPERFSISPESAERMLQARRNGGRIVAVGTTVVRALESAAATGTLAVEDGEASIFIRPGHHFAAVDVLCTNFHLPCTPLLVLVAAFAGLGRVREAYAAAIERGYRFYSYGDAMLIT